MKYLILATLLLTLSSCYEIFMGKDDTLTMTRTDYTGNQLKIDGYYYLKDSASYKDSMYRWVHGGIFLYRNGIIRQVGSSGKNPIDYDVYISSIPETFKKSGKLSVGVFLIQDKNIKIERWENTQPIKAYTYTGTIINDTTFHITERYRLLKGKKTELAVENLIYYYHRFSPKLDSTNLYVK